MKFFEEAKNIWINYVPKSGQSDTVEGELIRAIESYDMKLRIMGMVTGMKGLNYFASTYGIC